MGGSDQVDGPADSGTYLQLATSTQKHTHTLSKAAQHAPYMHFLQEDDELAASVDEDGAGCGQGRAGVAV